MKIIKPSIEILTITPNILQLIEKAGRTCYKSEANITEDSAQKFIKGLLKRGHESVIEHGVVTVRIICDRGVLFEFTRHRIASFSVESTRYCNYGNKDIEFIEPCFWKLTNIKIIKNKYSNKLELLELKPGKNTNDDDNFSDWFFAIKVSEELYKGLIKRGATPQEARSVLPNSLKTEIVVTMNLRSWRHFLKLRYANSAHPQMREIAFMILKEFKQKIPIVFDDLKEIE